MKCPFCAEEIQDAAILCRFCGATRSEELWRPPDGVGTSAFGRRKGAISLRLAGAFFLITAAYEVYSMTGAFPLAGAVRTGLIAVMYHLIFTAAYVAMGLGLLMLRPWGIPVLLAGTGLYTIDRLALLLDKAGISELQRLILGTDGLGSVIDSDTIVHATRMETVVLLACWWASCLLRRRKAPPIRPAATRLTSGNAMIPTARDRAELARRCFGTGPRGRGPRTMTSGRGWPDASFTTSLWSTTS